MRNGDHRYGVRASALWGSGKRGTGSRSNALWGSGKRRTALLATLALVALVPLGATASPAPGGADAYVTPTLLSAAQAGPTKTFDVIVQGKGNQAAKAVADVMGVSKKQMKDLRSIDGVATPNIHYIDVQLAPASGDTLDLGTITDTDAELTLS